MSNRFKFRIWDKIENDFYLDTYVLGTGGILFGDNYGFYEVNQKDFVIQQYTGVKDKNDKEIYEGDILLYKQHLHNTSMIVNRIDYIVYENAVFCFLADYGLQSFLGGMSNAGREGFEVIGNIFQNSELIK